MKALLLFIIPFVSINDGYHQLSWDDFKGKQTDKRFSAVTDCGTTLVYKMYDDKWYFYAYTDFEPMTSFSITKDPVVLIHEQGHLSIAELYTRKINHALEKYQGCPESILKIVDSLNDSNNKERNIFQDRYDLETNHSHNLAEQQRWNKWIEEQLK